MVITPIHHLPDFSRTSQKGSRASRVQDMEVRALGMEEAEIRLNYLSQQAERAFLFPAPPRLTLHKVQQGTPTWGKDLQEGCGVSH